MQKRKVFLYFRELKLTFLKLFFFCVWCSHGLTGLVYPLSSKPGGVPYNYGRGVLMRDFSVAEDFLVGLVVQFVSS